MAQLRLFWGAAWELKQLQRRERKQAPSTICPLGVLRFRPPAHLRVESGPSPPTRQKSFRRPVLKNLCPLLPGQELGLQLVRSPEMSSALSCIAPAALSVEFYGIIAERVRNSIMI